MIVDRRPALFRYKTPLSPSTTDVIPLTRSQSVIGEQFQNSENNDALSYYKFVFDS